MAITAPSPLPAGTVLDVAIIGAGVSGIYTGWRMLVLQRLLQRRAARDDVPARPAPRSRRGGGMCYLSTHEIVATPVPRLGLTPAPFPMGGDNNLMYLRGCRLRVADFKNNPGIMP